MKVDNIENYTLNSLDILYKEYQKLIDKSEGTDPDFPGFSFGDGKKVNGNNAALLDENDDNLKLTK